MGLGDEISRDYPSQLGWGKKSKKEIPEYFFPVFFPASFTGGRIVEYPFKVTQVSTGGRYSAFIDLDYNVWTCGDNFYGQLGHQQTQGLQSWGKQFEYEDNDEHGSLVPVKIPNFSAKMISCGDDHTVAIDLENKVWGWAKAFRYAREIIATAYLDFRIL